MLTHHVQCRGEDFDVLIDPAGDHIVTKRDAKQDNHARLVGTMTRTWARVVAAAIERKVTT